MRIQHHHSQGHSSSISREKVVPVKPWFDQDVPAVEVDMKVSSMNLHVYRLKRLYTELIVTVQEA
jgi:hypothetical protein